MNDKLCRQGYKNRVEAPHPKKHNHIHTKSSTVKMSSIKQPIPADSAIADLPTISFSRLAAREPAELEKLLESCRGLGFFYLDLRGDASKNILNDWRSVLDFMEKYFGQDYATKMKDDRQSDTHG